MAQVLRCFEDGNVTHVEGSVDPMRDAETVETELMLADLESLEKRRIGIEKKARGQDKEAKAQLEVIEPILAALKAGKPARSVILPRESLPLVKELQLLTAKPVLYVCNVDEGAASTGNAQSARVAAYAKAQGAESVVVSASIESEVAQLGDEAERREYLTTLGLSESGLARIIRAGYRLLDLVTFFTIGPKEAHAWTVPAGAKAPQAAGAIHTDFEKGFIRAEVIGYADFVACGGEAEAKEAGKMRVEGADYTIADGDTLHIRFNL
jgi:GTP-binding protein YchF